jgi:predicted nucleic acid-binding protein
MRLVIDASVALKWLIPEEGSDRAHALLAQDQFVAPDLLWAECANVLWQRVRRTSLSQADAMAALDAIGAVPIATVPTADVAARALQLAIELDHPVYDCLYLAVALREQCVLITADQGFAGRAGRVPAYQSWVQLL